MTCEPHWTAYVSAIAQPIVALLIACFAGWIAYQQYLTARKKLKLDLFDRRFAVYEVVRQTLGKAGSSGGLTLEDEVGYLAHIKSAQWLFGPEVKVYLDKTLWDKIVNLGVHNAEAKDAPQPERGEHLRARSEIKKWIYDQFEELDRMFSKYLKLDH